MRENETSIAERPVMNNFAKEEDVGIQSYGAGLGIAEIMRRESDTGRYAGIETGHHFRGIGDGFREVLDQE
jgi:hypothetical protein